VRAPHSTPEAGPRRLRRPRRRGRRPLRIHGADQPAAPGAARRDQGARLAALTDGKAMTAGEVASATGLPTATVSSTLSSLAKSGEVLKAARGYRLPYLPRQESDRAAPARPQRRPAATRNLRPMRLDGIQIRDIVEVDRLGRPFHALVTGDGSGGLSLQPLDRRVTYRASRTHEVVAHWATRGRPASHLSRRRSSSNSIRRSRLCTAAAFRPLPTPRGAPGAVPQRTWTRRSQRGGSEQHVSRASTNAGTAPGMKTRPMSVSVAAAA